MPTLPPPSHHQPPAALGQPHVPQQGYPYPPPGRHYPPPGYAYAAHPVPPPLPPPVAPGGQRLADFGDRLVAYLIDHAILFAANLVVLIAAFVAQVYVLTGSLENLETRVPAGSTPDFAGGDQRGNFGEVFRTVIGPILGLYAVMLLLILLIYYVYRVEMVFRTGQSVGKRVMKIAMVPLDPAATLTRAMATRRWLVDSVGATIVPGLVYLDGLWQLWDKPYQQCLHDKFARTVVIKLKP